MSPALAERTGSSLVRHRSLPDEAHTAVNYSTVDDPVLREELPKWESFLSASSFTFSPLASGNASSPAHGKRFNPNNLGAYEAVNWIAGTLSLPTTRITAATGIKTRTYFSWGSGTVTPRVSSQGQLWRLLSICEDLLSLLGADLSGWFMSRPDLQNSLNDGAFDSILEAALRDRSQLLAEDTVGPSFGLGGESVRQSEAPRWRPERRRPGGREPAL